VVFSAHTETSQNLFKVAPSYGTHLFVKVPRPEDKKGIFLGQAATCYYQSNHSLVEANPLSVLPKDTTSKGAPKKNLHLGSGFNTANYL